MLAAHTAEQTGFMRRFGMPSVCPAVKRMGVKVNYIFTACVWQPGLVNHVYNLAETTSLLYRHIKKNGSYSLRFVKLNNGSALSFVWPPTFLTLVQSHQIFGDDGVLKKQMIDGQFSDSLAHKLEHLREPDVSPRSHWKPKEDLKEEFISPVLPAMRV